MTFPINDNFLYIKMTATGFEPKFKFWVFIYEPCGCGSESRCCQDIATVLSKEFLDIQATTECRFTLKRVREMIITYSHSNILTQKNVIPVNTFNSLPDPYGITWECLGYSSSFLSKLLSENQDVALKRIVSLWQRSHKFNTSLTSIGKDLY